MTKTNIETILDNIGQNLNNGNWLSQACLELSAHLYYHNTLMSEARLAEKKIVVELLDIIFEDGSKPMSVTEAEKRAIVGTKNKYGKLKVQGEAIVQAINAIKARVKVLSWERGSVN